MSGAPICYMNNPNLKASGVTLEYTQEQIEEYKRCMEDPVYFCSRYVQIVHLDKGRILFEMYPFQKELVKTFLDNRFVVAKLPRQCGKTTTCVGYLLWFTLFHDDKKVAILANKGQLARDILSNYQLAYEGLPFWIQQGIRPGGWNKGRVQLENGSSVTASATSSSAIRGSTYNIVMLDEFGFVGNNIADEFMASVLPTISSSEEAQVIVISTPNGMNHYYKIWNDAEQGANAYKPFSAHWSDVPGRDEAWAQEQLKLLGPIKFAQEVECQFLGSADTLLDGPTLQSMKYKDPLEAKQIFKNQYLHIYEHPVKGSHQFDRNSGMVLHDRVYVQCVDIAEGLGLDYSAITVIDVTTIPYKVVAKWKSNTAPPMTLPAIITEIGKYYNNAYTLIEINQQPQVAESVFKDFKYPNIIYVTNTGNGLNQFAKLQPENKYRYGIKTSHTTKRIGCDSIKMLIEDGKLVHFDFDIYQEFTTFIRLNKTYGADSGAHDDLVMTLVLFGWLTTQDDFKKIANHDLRKQIQKDKLGFIEAEPVIEKKQIPVQLMDKYSVSDGALWEVVSNMDDYMTSTYSEFNSSMYW